MVYVGDNRVTKISTQRHILQVGSALEHMRRCVNVSAGMQAHVSAADDLAIAAVLVVFDDLDVELHVFSEAAIGAHVKGAGVQRQTDVYQLSGWQVQVHEILPIIASGFATMTTRQAS